MQAFIVNEMKILGSKSVKQLFYDDLRDLVLPLSTLLDADPQAVLRMPEDSLWPLVLALVLTVLFVALLFEAPVWTVLAGIATLASIGGWLWPTAATFPPRRTV